ncbi:unnamed protein product [Thelazia callipaeda]|uniref:Uncharacterized protein n=1 Tax=Thelazia callipaeda TaxID=103827 RepID=A0A0N5CSS5_THECL|nr:unnamed protein product [Thelazia callipaeda]
MIPSCLICKDEQKQDDQVDPDELNVAPILEYHKSTGVDNLDEIENEVLVINSTAWVQKPIDLKNWKEAVAKFADTYQTFGFDRARNHLNSLKLNSDAYSVEKEANKQNALKKWRRLPIIRIRIHKIEQEIFDTKYFGKNFKAFRHIDKIRNLINEAAKILNEVYNYYHHMDNEIKESNVKIAYIEEKLNARFEGEIEHQRPRCFWQERRFPFLVHEMLEQIFEQQATKSYLIVCWS